MEWAEYTQRFLGAWSVPIFALSAVTCLVCGLGVGEREGEHRFVNRFRARARYLRWLSMSCLSVVGAMLAASVKAVAPDALGRAAIFGLGAALLASVYRYIVRLSYFYESRADLLALIGKDSEPRLVGEEPVSMETCAQIALLLTPDAVEYPANADSLKKAVEQWLQTKK